jgi:hypothetical protein
MKLTQLAAKPQLIKVVLDDETIMADYNEPIEFYTWDRQPLDMFVRLAGANSNDIPGLIDVVRTLILDEEGKQIIAEDVMLPSSVLIKAIAKITELLGK